MRIVYGHDYYDSALAFGRDDAVVFVRQRDYCLNTEDVPYSVNAVFPKTVWFRNKRGETLRYYHQWAGKYIPLVGMLGNFKIGDDIVCEVKYMTVIFCGKIYNGVEVITHCSALFNTKTGSSTVFWTAESFQKWMDQVEIELFHSTKKHIKTIDVNILFGVANVSAQMMGWLIENKIVVAVLQQTNFKHSSGGMRKWSNAYWEINSDRLKNVQFFKKIDAYTAFQEISMWVGGVLPRPGADMEQISNVIRLQKHGFDKKTSFRKAKE